MSSRDLPDQPLSRRTLVAAAASPENLIPPHNRKKTRDIILCLPAQRKHSRTAPASSGIDAQIKKVDHSLHPNTVTPVAASSSGVEGKQAMKRRRFGTKSPLTDSYPIGNTRVPSSNLRRKPKELPLSDIRRMLMNKARTEILGYLDD